MALYKVELPVSARSLLIDGVTSYVVEAATSAAALVLVKAYRGNDVNTVWDNATVTTFGQDLEGLAFNITIDSPAVDITYTAVASDTWEDVAAALAALLVSEGLVATWTKDVTSGLDGTMVVALGNPNITAISAVIVSGGHGYEAADILTLAEGTVDPVSTVPATITVDTATNGAVTTATLTEIGNYTVAGDGTADPVTGGGGLDANFTLTWGEHLAWTGLDITAQIAAGGTGYTQGDTLTCAAGTTTEAATLTVTSVNAGVVDGVAVATPGLYSIVPGDAVGVTGGTGGDDFTLTATTLWRYHVASLDAVAAGGNGYEDADEVTLVGGTSGEDTIITVTTAVNGIITVAVVKAATDGDYSVVPANPVSVTGGSGTEATFTLTWDPYDNAGAATMTVTAVDNGANDVTAGSIDELTHEGVATADLSFVLLSTASSDRVLGAFAATA